MKIKVYGKVTDLESKKVLEKTLDIVYSIVESVDKEISVELCNLMNPDVYLEAMRSNFVLFPVVVIYNDDGDEIYYIEKEQENSAWYEYLKCELENFLKNS